MRVIVVGAGIIGASLSYHLVRNGACVVMIDRLRPGGCASAATFACINYFNYWQPPYFALRRNAIEYGRALAAQVGAEDFLHLNGTLRWAEDEAGWQAIDRSVGKLEALGIEVQRLSAAEVSRRLEPDLDLAGIERDIIHAPDEGWMDGVPYVGRVLAAAEASGKLEWMKETVLACEADHTGVSVKTANGPVRGDVIALAGGADTAALAKMLGATIPMKNDPGVMFVSDYLPSNIRHTLYAGPVHFRPDGGGRIMGGRHGGDFPPDCTPEQEADLIAGQVARRLKSLRLAPAHTVLTGMRPVPKDGYPVVGWLPGQRRAYVATCHSGMTLGPYLGKLGASEILSATEDELAPYRPERFDEARNAGAAGAPSAARAGHA